MTTPEEREARDSMCDGPAWEREDSATPRITLCHLPDGYLTPNTPGDRTNLIALGFDPHREQAETYGVYGNGLLAALSVIARDEYEILLLPIAPPKPEPLSPELRAAVAECVREEMAKRAETKAVLPVPGELKLFREVPVGDSFAFDGRTYEKFSGNTGWNKFDICRRAFHPEAPVRHFGRVKP